MASLAEIHRRIHFGYHGEDIWVRGRTYKAQLGPGGFTYIPFLGADSPRNCPVNFRLRSARVGRAALDLLDSAQVTREGARIVLDRGPVDVIYDTALESVGQSFLLDIAGMEGDVVIELDVTTDLLPTTLDRCHRFIGAHGGVDYGTAFAIDGRGSRVEIPSTLDEDTLRLTVPASIIAGLDGPLLVDPLISTYTVDDLTVSFSHVDVAFAAAPQSNVYVYQEQFSGQDADVYCRVLDSFNNSIVSGEYFDSSSMSVVSPKVAQVSFSLSGPGGSPISRCLVVGVRSFASGDNAIVGRILEVNNVPFGPEFTIATGTATSSVSGPDVGGSSNLLDPDPRFLVGFDRTVIGTSGFEESALVTVDVNGGVGTIRPISSVVGSVIDGIAISKGTGSNQGIDHWNFVCRFKLFPTSAWQILAGQVDADGNLAAGPMSVRTYFATERPEDLDVSDPLVDGGGVATYLVSARVVNGLGLNGKELLHCSGTSRLSIHSLTEMEHASYGVDAGAVRLGTTWSSASRPMFLAVYQERETFTQYGVYYTALNQPRPGELAIVERRVRVGDGAPPNQGGPMVASQTSVGFSSRRAHLAWPQVFDPALPTRITGATIELSNLGAIGQQYCHGAVNSTGDRGFLAITGPLDLTSPKILRAEALPPGVFGFFVLGQGSGVLPAAGGSTGTLCLGGPRSVEPLTRS